MPSMSAPRVDFPAAAASRGPYTLNYIADDAINKLDLLYQAGLSTVEAEPDLGRIAGDSASPDAD
jgi:hypothetical protein